ncbi:MAG: hypothetical protein N2511_06035, partial [Thermodesulfovibrionales bacterium]|nr:hypothetical protein [Thermodesulfovibrionales bacterium]
ETGIIDFKRYVYPTPEIVDVLSTSTPISEHVYTDYELWGCPIDKNSFVEVLTAFLLNKRPRIPRYSLCMECKSRGIPCIIVSN